jgi:hypothetical protein
VKSFEIDLRWKDVENASGSTYRFPSELTRHLKSHYDKPGIYRWAFFDDENRLIEAYIGETESISKRLYQYLRPGSRQQTNLRLRAHLDDSLVRGLKAKFQTLEFEDFKINGMVVNATALGNPHVRQFLEALAINDNRCAGCKILNAGEELLHKQLSRVVEGLTLSAEKKTALFEQFKGAVLNSSKPPSPNNKPAGGTPLCR